MQGLIGLVGLFVFLGYVYFLLRMIGKQHKIQRKEHAQAYRHQESDFIDYDGGGNWGRFVPESKPKRKTKFKKTTKV